MADAVIRVRDLEKRYRVWAHAPPTNLKERLLVSAASFRARAHLGQREQFRHDVWALRGVTFDVRRGEVLGVIGPNSAGKSTLLAILSRITEPSAGRVEMEGRVSSLLEVGTGFHPELSGRDNVYLNGAILGMSRAETARKFDEIVDFSGVGEFIDIPVKRYSSGMQVRLAFAVAAHLEPEVLLLDEVLAVGDAEFQTKCHARVEEIARGGRTVVFVSHDVASVTRLCQSAILLREGLITFNGPADEAAQHYLAGDGLDLDRPTDLDLPISLAGVQVRSEAGDGRARIGEPVQIVVQLQAREPVPMRELRVELALHHPTGGQYVALSTDLDGRSHIASETVSGRVDLECAVEALPIKPALYVVGAVLYRHGEVVDELHRAARLTLLSAPFFESGGPPMMYPAPTLVRHSWTLSDAGGHPTTRTRDDAVTSSPRH
jgi:lipopolysaccharide transport system ATP-binding protein